MLKCSFHNWWLLAGVKVEKDSVFFRKLRVWPCSSESMVNTNWNCFFWGGKVTKAGDRHGRTDKWAWLGCKMWNSKIINTIIMKPRSCLKIDLCLCLSLPVPPPHSYSESLCVSIQAPTLACPWRPGKLRHPCSHALVSTQTVTLACPGTWQCHPPCRYVVSMCMR